MIWYEVFQIGSCSSSNKIIFFHCHLKHTKVKVKWTCNINILNPLPSCGTTVDCSLRFTHPECIAATLVATIIFRRGVRYLDFYDKLKNAHATVHLQSVMSVNKYYDKYCEH